MSAQLIKQLQPYWSIEYGVPNAKTLSKNDEGLAPQQDLDVGTATLLTDRYMELQKEAGIVSLLPMGLGKKIESIIFHDNSRGVSTMDITFTHLTHQEVLSDIFNQNGKTLRLWLGWYKSMSMDKDVFCVFEGNVQASSYSYTQEGITAKVECASHSAVISTLNPVNFDLLEIATPKTNLDKLRITSLENIYTVNTIAQLIWSCAEFMRCKDVSIFFEVGDPIKKQEILDALGFNPNPLKLDQAAEIYEHLKQKLFSKNGQLVDKEGILRAKIKLLGQTPEEILTKVCSHISCNWWISPYGVLYFGVPPVPNHLQTIKAFKHRIFDKGFAAADMKNDTFEGFEVLETIQLPSLKVTYIMQTAQKNIVLLDAPKQLKYLTGNYSIEVGKQITPDIVENIGISFNETVRKEMQEKASTAEEVLKRFKGEADEELKELGYMPSVIVKNMEEYALFKSMGICRSENTVKVQIIGKITGAMGDPLVQVGSTIYFEGSPRHTGFYFVNEVTHTIKRNSSYKMELVVTLPKKDNAVLNPEILSKGIIAKNNLVVNEELGTITRAIAGAKWKGITIIQKADLDLIFESSRSYFKTKEITPIVTPEVII